jgi:beta-glucanase (GH16 family)
MKIKKSFLVILILFVAASAALSAAEWAPYTYYAVGTVVTYQGVSYTCRQSHTSLPGWEPPNVLALWLPGGTAATSTPGTATNTPTLAPGTTATPTKTPAPATPTPTAVSGTLWSDEFNGSGAPAWNYDLGGGGWGNSELEYYTSSTNNINQSGGILSITARKESMGGYAYTSSRIKSKFSTTYGRIEASIKVPMGQGLWPAFWMLGTNIGSVGWPLCGEIDIMEHINSLANVTGTIHWDAGGHAQYGTNVNCSPGNWNTYSIVWNSSAIKWYLNGAQYLEANILNNINSTEEFHRPFFILLNLAVGGAWPGSPNSSTVFPAVYQIDYVRWYSN